MTALLLLLALAPQAPAKSLSPLELQAGWELLFDGETLAGWHNFGAEDVRAGEGAWEVSDDCLHLPAGRGGGDLASDRTFADFELELEWRVAPGANSGIKYRVAGREGAAGMLGPEYQVLDDERHPDGRAPVTSAASLYALFEPEGKTLRPVGEFNHTRIVARGERLEHWLNGVRVVECTIGSPDWEARRAASKFAALPSFARGRGVIGLQDHGDEVWYRSIRVRDLEHLPGTPVELFDGQTLAGWKALGDARYVADDGCILGEVDGGGQSFLVTERSFGDFLLEVELKPELPGNSGIQVRSHVSEAGRVYGYQVEIDSSPRAWSGGLYDEGRRAWLNDLSENPAAREAFRPGEWNHYRIECLGPWIRTWVNGVPAADWLDPLDLEGFIGLQVHSGNNTRVRWRNFRMRDLGTRRWQRLEGDELAAVWSERDLRQEPAGFSGKGEFSCKLTLEPGVLGYRLRMGVDPQVRVARSAYSPTLSVSSGDLTTTYPLGEVWEAEGGSTRALEVLCHAGRLVVTSGGGRSLDPRLIEDHVPGGARATLDHGGDLVLESLERLGPPGR